MIHELLQAVSVKLNATFGDGYEIYVKDVKQGLKEPCFFLAFLQADRKAMLGNRSFQRNPFDIHYFPKNTADNCEMFAVAQQLMEAMELVTLLNGDSIRGSNRRYEIVDGVLHFFVHFNMHLVKPSERFHMETLSIESRTGKG